MKRKYLAFTLAEVLITLGIIGIVAQMTIPTMVNQSQKKVWVTQLQKFIAQYGAGMKAYMVQEGCFDMPCTGVFEGDRDSSLWDANVDKAVRSSFKILKSWDTRTYGAHTDAIYRLSKQAEPVNSWYYGHSFHSVDGYTFMVYDTDPDNCNYNSTVTTSSKLKGYCSSVYVDVNGDKKPNIWGRDIFVLYMGRDGSLYPAGGAESAKLENEDYTAASSYWKNNTGCGTEGSTVIAADAVGSVCSARIMESGWKMDY